MKRDNLLFGTDVYISEQSHVSGEVELKDNVSVWPFASIRGDRSKILIGKNTSVQDSATIHSNDGFNVEIGEYVTIGHNAIVHGAKIGDNTIIGMGAIVLDGATIGENSIIGAGAVIGGNKQIPSGVVVVGNPFKILRETTEKDREANRNNALEYVKAAKEYKNDEK